MQLARSLRRFPRVMDLSIIGLFFRTVRKNFSADALFQLVHSRFARLGNPRTIAVEIPLGVALMAAFAMFSLKDPSLLAFDERRDNPNDNRRCCGNHHRHAATPTEIPLILGSGPALRTFLCRTNVTNGRFSRILPLHNARWRFHTNSGFVPRLFFNDRSSDFSATTCPDGARPQ